jgi:hypothetical protein
MAALDPNFQFVTTEGDTQSYSDDASNYGYGFPGPYTKMITLVQNTLSGKEKCGAARFPLFLGTGNHEYDDSGYIAAFSNLWATNWSTPSSSKLATQLPGVTNFKAGPASVLKQGGGSVAVPNGTIYSFDYKNSHFVFVNEYEQGVIADGSAGVYDVNGSAVNDPTNSQLDWLAQDLQQSTTPFTFVVGHVALSAPMYSGNGPSGWSEHNSNFPTAALTQVLADNNVTAYFFGHDHVLSWRLLDRNKATVLDRMNTDAAGNSANIAGAWTAGRILQIDSGRVYNGSGSFLLTQVSDAGVTFKLYSISGTGSTLWDSFTVPVR